MAKTLYDVLEVAPAASPETIHAAYISLSKSYHPDKMVGLGADLTKFAEERLKELDFAYGILSDKERRVEYDKLLSSQQHNQSVPHNQTTLAAPSPPASVTLKAPIAYTTGFTVAVIISFIFSYLFTFLLYSIYGLMNDFTNIVSFDDFLSFISNPFTHSNIKLDSSREINQMFFAGIIINYLIGWFSFHGGTALANRISTHYSRAWFLVGYAVIDSLILFLFDDHGVSDLIIDVISQILIISGAYVAFSARDPFSWKREVTI